MTDKTTGDVAEALSIFDKFCAFIDDMHMSGTFVENDFMNKKEQQTIRRALTQQPDVNAELLDACRVALGHMTGGMDGEWRDCDPIELLREVLTRAPLPKIEGLAEAIDILEAHMQDMGDMAVVLIAARAYQKASG